MFATDAKTKARSNSRDCQEREAASQEFFRPRSGAHARQNCEKPPLAITAECARICIDQGCEYAVPKNGRQEILGRHKIPAKWSDGRY
jgi:hypothetical protein